MEELTSSQIQILNKLYQDYQKNIDSSTEDEFVGLNLPLEELRANLKFLESNNLVNIGERRGPGILMWIQITKSGINFIEDSSGCS